MVNQQRQSTLRRVIATSAAAGALIATAVASPAGATTNTPNGPLPTCSSGDAKFQKECIDGLMSASTQAWYIKTKPPRY